MYNSLLHAHSGLRWVALILIIITIVNCAPALTKNRSWSLRDRKLSMFAMTILHLQVVIGLIMYFMSPNVRFSEGFMEVPALRFFTVEHIVLMLLAAVFVTLGYTRAKRLPTDAAKFKSVFWFFLIGLLVLIAGIPWPFRGFGAGWF